MFVIVSFCFRFLVIVVCIVVIIFIVRFVIFVRCFVVIFVITVVLVTNVIVVHCCDTGCERSWIGIVNKLNVV